MKNKKRIWISLSGILIVMLLLIGLTYGYYLTKIIGNTNSKSISVTTAKLELVYDDGNGLITSEKIMPGTVIDTKTFSVSNKGNHVVNEYVVYLEDVINNFYYSKDVTYNLECKSVSISSGNVSGTCNGVTNGIFPKEDSVLITNNINAGIRHEYSLTVTYNESNTDQSRDMKKQLSGKVNIYDRTVKYQNLYDISSNKTLLKNISTVQDLATNYLSPDPVGDTSTYFRGKDKWLVFNSISKLKYDSSKWDEVAGAKDANFLTYLKNNNFDINTLKTNYVATLDNNTGDFVHFAAPLASQMYNTDALLNLAYTETQYDDLSGWAGDLQTLISNNVLPNVSDTSSYDEAYNVFLKKMGASSTYFDLNDLYSDVDAVNLYYKLTKSNDTFTILETYFKSGFRTRFKDFITKLAGSYDLEALKTKVGEYTKTLYVGNTTGNVPGQVGNASRDAFAQYLWNLSIYNYTNIYSEDITYKKGSSVNFYAEVVDNDFNIISNSNNDFTWSVTKSDGTKSNSTIDENGLLTISSSETVNNLRISVVYNKTNAIVKSKIITLI